MLHLTRGFGCVGISLLIFGDYLLGSIITDKFDGCNVPLPFTSLPFHMLYPSNGYPSVTSPCNWDKLFALSSVLPCDSLFILYSLGSNWSFTSIAQIVLGT